ncbi:hypothetical protein [Halopiger thermotolerans]
MTDTDREYISGEGDATDNQRMQSVSRVRSRINKELPTDIEVLEEHRPDLLENLRDVVCDDANPDGGRVETVNRERMTHALDDLEAALERGDRDRVEEALERARDELEDGGTDE